MDENPQYTIVEWLLGIGIVIVAIWAVLMAAGVMAISTQFMFEAVF